MASLQTNTFVVMGKPETKRNFFLSIFEKIVNFYFVPFFKKKCQTMVINAVFLFSLKI